MLGLNHSGQQISLRLTEPNDRGGNAKYGISEANGDLNKLDWL